MNWQKHEAITSLIKLILFIYMHFFQKSKMGTMIPDESTKGFNIVADVWQTTGTTAEKSSQK